MLQPAHVRKWQGVHKCKAASPKEDPAAGSLVDGASGLGEDSAGRTWVKSTFFQRKMQQVVHVGSIQPKDGFDKRRLMWMVQAA